MVDKYQYKWWALLGVCLLAATSFLDATIVNTALPFIQTELKASILQLQWVANIFTIVLSMTMIAMGKFADLWGKKRIFYIGIVIFALGALGAGFSNSIAMMVLFRGLQAIGASIVYVVSAALLSDVFPEAQRVRAISVYSGATGFGLMIGPFLGGILISVLGWRWVFWINLPLIAIGLVACSFSLRGPQHVKEKVKVDWLGLLLLIVGLGSLMYGIIDGAQEHWAKLSSWLLVAVGIAALVLLIVLDEVRKNPLLDLHIFKNKLIVLGALSCALGGVISTVFMFFDPLYLRILRQLSPLHIGMLIAVIPAAQVFFSFFFNRAVKRFGVSNLLIFSIITAFLAAALHRGIQDHTSLWFLILPFFLLGINWGLSYSSTITAANQVIAPTKIGAALGTIATIWNIVGSLILAISTAIFHSVEAQSSFLPAFHSAIDFIIIFVLVIMMAAIWVRIKIKLPKNS